MFSKFAVMSRATLSFVVAAVLLAGCGSGMSGKYSSSNGVQDITLDFQSGDKVMANIMGNTVEGTYKVDGDKVTVYINGKNMVLTKEGSDTLTGGPMGMTLKKE